MRRITIIAFMLLVAPAALPQQENDGADEMRRWMRQQRDDFDQYVSAQDAEFAAFLSEAWREFDVSAGRVRDQAPKPREVPMAPKPVAPPPVPDQPDTAPLPDLRAPTPPPPPPASRPVDREIDVSFLGLIYRLPADRHLGDLPRTTAGPEAAGDAWLALSRIDTDNLFTTVDTLARNRQLGDWGRFRLLEAIADGFYPADHSRRALLHWYLAVRSGLDVRLAYARPGYVVLYATEQAVYQVHFFMHEQTAYYLHDPDGRFTDTETLRTYDGQVPDRSRGLTFDFSRLPLTEPDLETRTLDWALNGQPRETEIELDRRLVSYLGTVPQVGLESHFGAAVSPRVLQSLAASLAPDLASRDTTGRVAVLLHFVQTALPYSTDGDQFGYEDYLYPDESLYYPACDCEDRAALFATLVRELVGLDVVGLDYPGHIATGVALPGDVPGDRFTWRDVWFTVCDPTYIGAGLGRSMPIAGSQQPGIIDVSG